MVGPRRGAVQVLTGGTQPVRNTFRPFPVRGEGFFFGSSPNQGKARVDTTSGRRAGDMERKGLPATAGPVRSLRGKAKKQTRTWEKNLFPGSKPHHRPALHRLRRGFSQRKRRDAVGIADRGGRTGEHVGEVIHLRLVGLRVAVEEEILQPVAS